MKFFLRAMILSVVALATNPAFAYFGKSNEGRAVFTWTALLQTPRTIAMGGSAGALPSEDAGAASMNPAAYRQNANYLVAAAWQSGDFVERQGLLFVGHQAGPFRVLHTYGFVDNGSVDGYDEAGEATGVVHRPLAQTYAATLAWSMEHFQLGWTGRLLWERLSESTDAQTAVGTSFDWGLQWQPSSPRYGLAFAARNLGTMLRPYVKNGETDFATSSELAISSYFRPATLPRLALTGEASAPRYAPVAVSLGGEYSLGSSLFLRAGLQRNAIDVIRQVRSVFASEDTPEKTGTHRMFSVGAGYQYRWIGVDYSFSYLEESMGSEHRLGLKGSF